MEGEARRLSSQCYQLLRFGESLRETSSGGKKGRKSGGGWFACK